MVVVATGLFVAGPSLGPEMNNGSIAARDPFLRFLGIASPLSFPLGGQELRHKRSASSQEGTQPVLGRMGKEERRAKSCVTAEKSIAAYGPDAWDARVSLHPLQYPWFAPVKCFSISLGKRLALQCPASSDVRQC